MKKTLLAYIALCCTCLSLSAQSSIVPVNPPLVVKGFADQSVIQAKFDVKNQSGNNILVMLRRDIIYQVPGTKNNICWGIYCYPDHISETPTPSLIPPFGVDTTFRGDYNPQGHAGSTKIMYTFFNKDNPSDSASVIIEFVALPPPSLFGTFTYCNGDSAVLNAGNAYDSYLWSNGLTTSSVKVPSGTYWVEVQAGWETRLSDTATVQQAASFSPVISGNPYYCANGDAVLDAGAGYDHYLWSTGDTASEVHVLAGVYTVTVSDNSGCSGVSAPTAVTENPNPAVPVVSWNDTVLTASQGDYYQWYANGFVMYGETGQTVQPIESGTFYVEVCDTGSWCCTLSDTVQIVVSDNEAPDDVHRNTAYPNPCNEQINFTWVDGKTIRIYNVFGKLVYSGSTSGEQGGFRLHTDNFADGLYFYAVQKKTAGEYTGKFQVIH